MQSARARAADYYDQYWDSRSAERTRARSRGRARLALELLDRAGISRGASLLEVGCGPGWALEVFLAAGLQARGIELSPRAVEMARSRDLPVERLDLQDEALPDTFELIAALEVLEHVTDPLSSLERLRDGLSVGGHLLISLPNEWTLPGRLAGLVGRPGFGGFDDPHIRHFDVAGHRRLFEAAGLEVIASAWDGLAPPRWSALKSFTEPLAQACPSLFAISGVHLLAPRAGTSSPEGVHE